MRKPGQGRSESGALLAFVLSPWDGLFLLPSYRAAVATLLALSMSDLCARCRLASSFPLAVTPGSSKWPPDKPRPRGLDREV